MLQAAAHELTRSWRPRTDLSQLRGARLEDAHKNPHAVYAAQSLFSIYVHTRPDFPGYPASSIFYGREIIPRFAAGRYRHSLAVVSLLLLEAALTDNIVQNVHFVVISGAEIPLYNGAMLYMQLLNEKRSRLGPTRTFRELLTEDWVRPAAL
jgi:hypothetical protein